MEADVTTLVAVAGALGLGGVAPTVAKSLWPANREESLRSWTLNILDRKEKRDDALIDQLKEQNKQQDEKIEELTKLLAAANETIALLREQLAALVTRLDITQGNTDQTDPNLFIIKPDLDN